MVSFYEYISSIAFLACLLSTAEATAVNDGKEIWCHQAKVHDVRIKGCTSEPCTVRKGVRVPVEIDFEFQVPTSTNRAVFQVFISYWSKPPGFYGSYFANGNSCSELGLPCPVNANTRYTMKSSIYIDPESKDTLNEEEVGQRKTNWRIYISESQDSNSVCTFTVQLNISKQICQ